MAACQFHSKYSSCLTLCNRTNKTFLPDPNTTARFSIIGRSILLFVFSLVLFLFSTGCSPDESLNAIADWSPEWRKGYVVDFSAEKKTVTIDIEEEDSFRAVYSLENLGDTHINWVFSVINIGDSVSASSLDEAIKEDEGVNMALNFKIAGYEEKEAEISRKSLEESIADITPSNSST